MLPRSTSAVSPLFVGVVLAGRWGLLGREHVVQLSISRPGRPLVEPIISLYIVLDLLGLGRDSLLWRHTSATHPTNRFRARDGWASSW